MLDHKKAIVRNIEDMDLVLCVLNSIRDSELARLALIEEAEKRDGEDT